MRRYFRWDKKYLYWGITAFCVIALCVIFYMALSHAGLLVSALKALAGILSPFIWGLVISYLLFPLVKVLHHKVFRPFTARLYKNSTKHRGIGLARVLSVFCAEIVMLLIVAALLYMVIPQLYISIETIVANSPIYITNLTNLVTRLLADFPELESVVTGMVGNANESVVTWLQNALLPKLGNMLTNLGTGVYYVLIGLYNFAIGIIASVYLLCNMEGFGASCKRMIYSILSVDKAKQVLDALAFVNRTFMGFINGKLLDSAIIGILCYVVCSILDMPFTLLVSVIVGVTNIIPFFGPFIGAIPSSIIILMVSPIKCLIFIVFILLLQQLDGNVIGPKILGSTTGINAFWVMFSIILGAGLFGFWGMLLGVPVFVVIYTAINVAVENSLKRKNLPSEQLDYFGLDHIDPITMRPIQKEGIQLERWKDKVEEKPIDEDNI